MFKKAIAMTLALVMLLMPMTASAVTWSKIVAQLKTNPTYSEGELTAEKSGDVTTVKNGEVEFDEDIFTAGTYVFIDVHSNTRLYAVAPDNEKINIQIKGDSEFGEVVGHAQGENTVVNITNEATVGTLWGYSLDNGMLNLVNQGNATELGASANRDGNVNVLNQGTVAEDVSILAREGGSAELLNTGTGTVGNMLIHAEGEDSIARGTNDSNGVVQGTMNGNAIEGSSVSVVNRGTVEEDFRASAQDASEVTAQNYGTVGAVSMGVGLNSEGKLVLAEGSEVKNGEFWNFVSAYDDSHVSFENNTSIDNLIVGSSDGSLTEIDNTKGSIGKTGVNMVDGIVQFNGMENTTESYVYLEFSEEPTAEQLKEIIAGVGSPEGVYLGRENADGEWEEYLVTPDGELILIEYEEEEDEQEPIPEPDPIELQRQAEGIGGVTTSPVWNWQGYLGHSSKPMWIYVNGEKVMMRQRLFWLGDSTKNHTCRINVTEPDPASVELRVGLDMLRTAQRAEISVISILDAENNTIAQFAVSDLLGAFEQYGLVEGELLCVSADADAEVMKVTLSGEYLPLEAE